MSDPLTQEQIDELTNLTDHPERLEETTGKSSSSGSSFSFYMFLIGGVVLLGLFLMLRFRT